MNDNHVILAANRGILVDIGRNERTLNTMKAPRLRQTVRGNGQRFEGALT